jgi:hypothetical protein
MLVGMQYWELVTRSFRISWRHKYLWLIALFAGESGGGFQSSYQTRGTTPFGGTGNGTPDIAAAQNAATRWIGDHTTVIVAVGAALILLWIAFFVLAAICEGATVRAAAEHDAERPFGLGLAWRCGRATMGTVIRLRLLIIALVLPVAIIVVALVIGFVFAIVGGNAGGAIVLGIVGLLVVLAAIPYTIYVSLLDRLGTRAVVLEEVAAAVAALKRGHGLLRERLGRVLLVWLLSIAVGIAVGIVVAVALLVGFVPLVVLAIAAAATGSALLWILIVVGVLVVLPIALVIQGFVSAQSSTYWTVAFRRLEINSQPAPAYPSASTLPAPPPPQSS